MKNFQLLARLFGRTENPVIAALYTHAIGRPLLVHPGIGEQLLGAYMNGAIDAPGPIIQPAKAQQEQRVAVMNISGALISRPEPGLCDDGPVSYEALREVFDAQLEDEGVSHIVMRINSPGGLASGLFDFTDHVYAMRGTKPVIAVVDDIAYSAAYAIAAAADEIWVSRTSGAGSIGAAAFHVDQSELDKKIGIKITPIYAGGAKIDFNSHFALSDEAKVRAQAEIDTLYTLFTSSVARYRGVDVEKMVATDALTYVGQAAIDVGLADRLGTMRDAVASLEATPPPVPSTQPDPEEEKRAQAEAAKGKLAVALSAAKLPATLTAALLGQEVPVDQIEPRIEHARVVADLCHAAQLDSCAVDFVTRNTSIETVRAELAAAVADDPKTQITTTLPAKDADKRAAAMSQQLDPTSIYANRSK